MVFYLILSKSKCDIPYNFKFIIKIINLIIDIIITMKIWLDVGHEINY